VLTGLPAGYSQRAAPVGLDIRPAVVTYLKVRCAVRPGFPGERTGSRCPLATTASQARCPATGGLWNVRPPWHHEYRPEDVSGAHESRWLMIVDRVDVSYCEGWDSRTRAAVGPLSLALAEERHQAGEQCAVLLAAAGRPLALIEVALGELHGLGGNLWTW